MFYYFEGAQHIIKYIKTIFSVRILLAACMYTYVHELAQPPLLLRKLRTDSGIKQTIRTGKQLKCLKKFRHVTHTDRFSYGASTIF